MLRDLAWQKTDAVTRRQLDLLCALCDQHRLTIADRQRMMNLTEAQWAAWTDFLVDGPLPATPPLPEMMLRMGEIAFTLSLQGEQAL